MSEKNASGGHGGNLRAMAARLGCSPEEILDFSANINPLGPPEYLWNLLAGRLGDIVRYPDPDSAELVQVLAEQYQLPPEQIVPGNGTSDLLYATLRALAKKKIRRALIPVPAYIDYRQACEQAGVEVVPLPLSAEDDFQPDLEQIAMQMQAGDVVILGQPNNPTGRMIDRKALLDLTRQHPEIFFLLDEAFAGFVPEYTSLAGYRKNAITLCSLTKIFAVPGLRLGFLAASEELCDAIKGQLAPWGVNTLAQAAGKAMIGDAEYIRKTQEVVTRNREALYRDLATIPSLRVIEGRADFLLIRLSGKITAVALAERLLEQTRMAIRACSS
ncbi:MAG: pyridoxal phosphate-dependent class II aminotransferase, partial [Candidatus Electrothrix sp. ATG1]|nr:pyridoxal phosphate-dependent class II aminotransferase [Candidatus Electrothrix sp. ATG1]